MHRIVRWRPLSSSFGFYGRSFSSKISANHAREATLYSSSSESLINDQAPSPPPSEPASKKLSSSFLKFALFGTLAGATAAVGYASYDVARNRPAVSGPILDSYKGCDIESAFIARSKDHQRRMQEQGENKYLTSMLKKGRFCWQR